MSKVCQITGKRPGVGCSVSHSNRHTKRRYMPNLQVQKVFNPVTGEYKRMKVSTSALRTLLKSRVRKKSAKA